MQGTYGSILNKIFLSFILVCKAAPQNILMCTPQVSLYISGNYLFLMMNQNLISMGQMVVLWSGENQQMLVKKLCGTIKHDGGGGIIFWGCTSAAVIEGNMDRYIYIKYLTLTKNIFYTKNLQGMVPLSCLETASQSTPNSRFEFHRTFARRNWS